uniref:Chlorophyll synthase n=1 Tax=Hemiselmis tepida TaxID=464990 RepID=A0A7S0VXB6_9CRYP|mmetsp:Transcript_23525/g.59512  ORF Transcript_23525/g.59512 Transcript_23525/m.59512 type:complete len:387 (+) Transcript_23525:27-1187(+)
MRIWSSVIVLGALCVADAFHTPLAPIGLRHSAALSHLSPPSASRAMPARKSQLRMQQQPESENSGIKQLLGVRGGSRTDNVWAIRLQLTKPVTWVPLVWGVACGAAASGKYNAIWDGASFDAWSTDFLKAIVCMILAGPLLTGYTQTINDWYDREIDAINEPDRPIPSGAISENEVIAQIWVLLLGGLGLAYGLDVWAGNEFPAVFALSVFGSFISYIYSAPPLKLKQSGWIGNYALGASYISLPWWCGQCFFNLSSFNPTVAVLTTLYSLAGLGIAIVNDFKSIEGDRAMGLMSLPVQFGVDKAKWICVGTIDATQLGVAAYLASVGETNYALVLLGLILPQIYLQVTTFLPNPIENDVKYQAAAQPFLVFGILTTALACGHHTF